MRRLLAAAGAVLTFILLLASFTVQPCWAANPSGAGPEKKETEPEETGPLVSRITITGNQAVSQKEIKAAMELKESDWKFWRSQPRFDPFALERDREAIKKLYQAEGYYQAMVETRWKLVDKAAVVNIDIKEGDPIRIKSVDLELTGLDEKWRDRLTSLARRPHLVQGEIFRLEGYRKAKAAVLRRLAEEGYGMAGIKADAKVSLKKGQAAITFRVRTGPPLKLGRAEYQGNKRTAAYVLANELAWKKGDRYDIRLLDKTQQRLLDLGVFSLVRLEPQFDKREGELTPVKVTVVERKPHSVSIGVGYGSEDDFRVRLTQTNRSFFGFGEILSFSGQYSGRTRGGLIDYRQPRFLGYGQYFNLQIGHTDRTEVSYKNQRSFAGVALTSRLGEYWRLETGYGAEINHPYDVEIEELNSVSRDDNYYLLTGPTLSLTMDSRDDILDPTRGMTALLKGQVAPEELGSEIGLYQVDASLSGYQPLTGWLTLALRLRGAVVDRFDGQTVPIFKRFFAGGNHSIRGYPYQRLGPLDDKSRPVGGQTLIEASIEGRFPIYGPLTGVVFGDAGHVTVDPWTFSGDEVRYTTGVGLRYKTLIGPLRFDIGYELNPPERADFDRIQLHFTIGQAF